MFLVMQSPCNLREAETKKGRCSVFDNGPLTFPRQLDVVADAFIATWAFDLGLKFPKYAANSGTHEHTAPFAQRNFR